MGNWHQQSSQCWANLTPRIILHSSIDEGELRRRAEAAGVDGWIPKGVPLAAVAAALAG